MLIDQRSRAKIMFVELYKGLGLKQENLTKYDMPLVGFVVPEGKISLSIMTEGKEVIVNFIMVNAFSPYTAILGRPWIHAMGTVPSTLHMKVKFPTEDGVAVVKGDQQAAQQCMVATINHEIKLKKQVEPESL